MKAPEISRQDIANCAPGNITGKNSIVDVCKTCNIICSIMDVVLSFDQFFKGWSYKRKKNA